MGNDIEPMVLLVSMQMDIKHGLSMEKISRHKF